MKKSVYCLVTSLLVLSFSNLSFAKSVVIGLSSPAGQAQLDQFQSEIESKNDDVQILRDFTKRFKENENTYVQLFHPETNTNHVKVVNRRVEIMLPSSLDFNSLMEALIKVRAARTFGASEVYVNCQLPLSEMKIAGELAEELSLEEMFAVAGADFVLDKNGIKQLVERKPSRNTTLSDDYWIGSSNHPELLSELSGLLGKPGKTFESLQLNPKLLKGRKIYWISASTTPANTHFFITLAQIQWMKKQGASVHLISPYLPYARSDKPEFDVGVTTQGRLIADLIESAGTEGITVVRAHAPQSLGFFKIHSEEISGRPTITEFLKSQNIDCIISPDAGFQKDATKYQHELSKAYGNSKQVCLVVMNKERNSDGKETILGGTGVENIAGKNVVIIDDETSSGGTLHQVASVIQKYSPTSIFAVVTHLAGNAQKSLNSEFIQTLISTNTVPISSNHQKLKVLSIASEIAASVQRAESNR